MYLIILQPSFRRPRRSESTRRHERESRQKIIDQRRKIEEEAVVDNRVVEPPIDENFDRPVIYTEYHFEEKMVRRKCSFKIKSLVKYILTDRALLTMGLL